MPASGLLERAALRSGSGPRNETKPGPPPYSNNRTALPRNILTHSPALLDYSSQDPASQTRRPTRKSRDRSTTSGLLQAPGDISGWTRPAVEGLPSDLADMRSPHGGPATRRTPSRGPGPPVALLSMVCLGGRPLASCGGSNWWNESSQHEMLVDKKSTNRRHRHHPSPWHAR